MNRKACSGMILTLLLISMLILASNTQPVGALTPPATEWTKTYGGTNHDRAWSVVQTSDGGYAIAGDTMSYGGGNDDFWLVKTNFYGTKQWSKTYGGSASDTVWSSAHTADGGYVIVGDTTSYGSGQEDFWVVKTDSSGSKQWSQTYGGSASDMASSVRQTADRGYIIAGRTSSYGSGQDDFWLIKLEGLSPDGEIADYVVLTPEIVAGDQLRVQVTVENIGEIRAEYNVYIGNIWDSEGHNVGNGYSESHQIIQLDPGASQILTLVWTTSSTMEPGTYTGDLVLQIARPGGGWEETKIYSNAISFTIVIPTEIPIAVLSASPTDVEVGETVTFDGGSSYDPDGGSIVSYFYYFDDGFDSGWTSQSTYPYEYTGEGDYYAKLKVEDDEGQISSWSSTVHIHVRPIQPQRTISLKSETTDGLENVNNNLGTTIVFDSDPYSVPDTASKTDGTYTAQANPPGSYSFHHWECFDGVSVDPAEKYSNPAQISVGGDGELKAVFFLDIRLYFSQSEEYFPLKGLDFDKDGYINFNAWQVRNFPEWNVLEDIDGDSGAVSGIPLDAPAYTYSTNEASGRVVQFWLYYAMDSKAVFPHEHDFESLFILMDDSHVILEISLNQHFWSNSYETSLETYYGTPPRMILVAVERAGHAMILLDPSSLGYIRPDNSPLETPPFDWVYEPTQVALLYTWKIYDGVHSTDDGFGNSNFLRTGTNYAILSPTLARDAGNWFVSLAAWMSGQTDPLTIMSAIYNTAELTYFFWYMGRSQSEYMLLKSNEPYETPLYNIASQKIYMFVEAPWIRDEFNNPLDRFEFPGFSQIVQKSVIHAVAWVESLAFRDLVVDASSGLARYVAKTLWDPVQGSIVDAEGRITGYKDGAWVEEIPGVLTLWRGGDFDVCLILGETQNISYVVNYAGSNYTLDFSTAYFDNSSVAFRATEIPLSSSNIHSYEIDWDILKEGQDGTTVSVDLNGDGAFDQIFQTGINLTSGQMFRAHNLGTGMNFTTIQGVIDNSTTLDGHTIRVDTGIYFENLTLTKSLILVGESNSATIIDGNGMGTVVRVTTDNVEIRGFTIENGDHAGIELDNADFCIIRNNILTNNTWAGINLRYSCFNNVSDNNFAGNYIGIRLVDQSNNNKISRNNISNNIGGIGLSQSSNNVVYHNNLLNNTVWSAWVGSYSFDNIWDDGYPSGGNYWSDYNGTDQCSGPYQNITGSDGISDTLYVIDENNTDRYPLMKPYPWGPHDVGITSITTSKTVVGQGFYLHINVTIFNYGNNTETFNVSVFYDDTVITLPDGKNHTTTTLTSGNYTILTIPWNTAGVAMGNYTIKAEATQVPGDTDVADNTLTDGWVIVTWLGDFDGDFDVDIDDIRYFCSAYIDYWSTPSIKDPLCDFDGDCDIDIDDIRTFCSAYIEYWTS